MTEFCKTERDGHILVVTINRPERMNALHPPANFELEKVFDDFAKDDDLWVAIVTGEGERAFSAGNDLRWQAEGNKMEVPKTGFAGLTARYDLNEDGELASTRASTIDDSYILNYRVIMDTNGDEPGSVIAMHPDGRRERL